ncbi:hypothetical protein [Maribacter cobaltidurans]|uniref:Uncharacterized protein n=1 Tax=Maribacter cobaltidurans TaxID=1178778 RepID=A0A223V1L6_9FLAO|nr:hypothetical protein [Maribacter cobaltidurans]ASV29254.1 hypothetical protein CJ263_02890 [Maribacter cobaltidurans]GGD70610.1 hypothetical protein GCM10011412_05290 [Maribacter cobaltidurans]
MNAKWCVGTLIIILALMGLNQEHSKASNQQISLQFTDVAVASETTHDEVLSAITKKLAFLGVDDIEIIENDGSHVNIRYYSDIDAEGVKEFLSQDLPMSLTYDDDFPSDFPKEELPENYNLVVSDLHQYTQNGLNLKGNLVPIQKQVGSGFSNPVILQFNKALVVGPNVIDRVAFNIHKNIALAIDYTSHNIPEVRAGPYFCGKS